MSNVMPEADDYDLTAFNEHIKQATVREKAITLDIRLKALQNNLPKIMWWLFIGAVIISFVSVAIGYTIRLAIHPPVQEKFIQPEIPKEFKLNIDDLRVGIDSPISANVELDRDSIGDILSSYNDIINLLGSNQREISKQLEANAKGINSLTDKVEKLSNDLANIKNGSNKFVDPFIQIDPQLQQNRIKKN